MRPSIGIGDLLTTWGTLGRDITLARSLGRVLGLTPLPVARTPTQKPAVPTTTRSTVTPPSTPSARDEGHRTEPAAAASATEPAGVRDVEHLIVRPLPPEPERFGEQAEQPVWLTGRQLAAPTTIARVTPAPLFAPRRERALLAAAGRLPRAEGAIDLEQLVEQMARRATPRTLPRRRVLSLRGGVQILVDRSPWMAPFIEDVAAIAGRLRGVAGDVLDELSIDEMPPEVQRHDELSPRPWIAPSTGTAVIAITDLGRSAARHGEHATRSSWTAFLHRLVAAGFTPVVIVPGRPSTRRDLALPRSALTLAWDRGTRVAEITRFRKAQRR